MENKTELELKWVKEFLIPELISNGSLNGNGLNLEDISINFIGTSEAFMLTNCFKVHLNYQINNNKYSEHLVVKKTPKISKENYDAINFETLYENEIIAYTKLLPELSALRPSTLRHEYPKYYYSYLKENEACIVLEDFAVEGWCMTKKKCDLSIEHLLLAAKYIGKFHGICYDLKHNNPEFFNSIIKSLGESRYAKEPPADYDIILKASGQRSINSAKKYYGDLIPEKFLKTLNTNLKDIFNHGKQILRPSEPQAILCHGDYVRNNVAFKYNKSKDKDMPTDMMMFDYQTLRYASPMCDLTTFISLSSSKETRSKHFERIFKSYCDELKSTYEDRTSNKIPDYLSYDSLLEEYVLYLPYSLGIASSFLSSLYEPIEEQYSEDFINQERTPESIIEDALKRGGEIVDKELASLVYELYDFSQKLNIDIP